MSKMSKRGPARTNTGASIRGKISAPIPMKDDDEFPIRLPGTGIASSVGPDGVDKQLHLRPISKPDPALTRKEEVAEMEDKSAPSSHHAPIDTFDPVDKELGPGAASSTPSHSSVGHAHKRKKSSLRTVFGRLFGKKRTSSISETSRQSSTTRAELHRSDPTALSRTSRPGTLGSGKRSVSFPVNEFNRALRSHSVVSDDFLAKNLIDASSRQSLQVDGRTTLGGSTPSRLRTPNRTPGFSSWAGLSPRPASSHHRASKLVDGTEHLDETIGVALTSGSHPRRRSRSLGQLREAAGSPQGDLARRRSDEIRYWRASYDAGLNSPMSLDRAEAEPEEPLREDEENMVEVKEPPQPFHFGSFGSLSNMKITEAVSLETRVSRLEERVVGMERSISRTSNPPLSLVQESPSRPLSSRNASFARPRTGSSEVSVQRQSLRQQPQTSKPTRLGRSSSYGSNFSLTSASNYQASTEDSSFTTASGDHYQPSQQLTSRPRSTSATIRDSAANQIKELQEMILIERSARQNLEAIVHNLQQQLQTLHAAAAVTYTAPSSAITPHPLDSLVKRESSFLEFDGDNDASDYSQDEFQTPMEDASRRAGFEPAERGHAKSNSRTMSLSQMTLGKGGQMATAF